MSEPAMSNVEGPFPERCAGVLFHPTSLPSGHGIGDLGPAAIEFLEWISDAGFGVWQVLPLGPTGRNDSPYDSPSAFAGNTLLVSAEMLIEAGWLPADDPSAAPRVASARVDYGRVVPEKAGMLARSWEWFRRNASREDRLRYDAFVEDPAQSDWLEDWVLYAAIKERYGGASWIEWDEAHRLRWPDALRAAGRDLADSILRHRYSQFAFFTQWEAVRAAAHARRIRLLGDAPFCVALDSADVWAHRDLFVLDDAGRPLKVAGVPPDYFSETGQLWGNPIYRWDRLADSGYDWWVRRIGSDLRRVDVLRLDHFRGFAAYWEVDAGAEDATGGRWIPGPGAALFDALEQSLGRLPLVAEDLGLITEDVAELRGKLGLPGMHVLQFAFADEDSCHLPERHARDSVAYTGTHDNDTLRGWFAGLDSAARGRVLSRLETSPDEVVWRLIEETFRSRAQLSIAPLQDLLNLEGDARMNVPGVADGNWDWRVARELLTPEVAARLRSLVERTGRGG
jgi:4-alpha-glucanotransferase